MESAIVERAQPAHAKLEESVSVSYSVMDYESAQYHFDYQTLGIAHNLWLAPGFELGTGMRLGLGIDLDQGYAVEAFGSLMVVPRFRTLRDDAGRTASWRPAGGIELGLSSAKSAFPSEAAESIVRTDRAAPLYLVFLARPARFRFSSFHVSAFGLGFGPAFGSVTKLRVQLDLLQIGLVL